MCCNSLPLSTYDSASEQCNSGSIANHMAKFQTYVTPRYECC
jgi:hypothetical protein